MLKMLPQTALHVILKQTLSMTAAPLLQAGCLLAYTLCLTLWFYTELLTHRRR
jgi:hypothetical protein